MQFLDRLIYRNRIFKYLLLRLAVATGIARVVCNQVKLLKLEE